MFFNEDHLKITKIRTNNGTTPVFDEQGRPLKKIVFAPKNKATLRLFEDQNRRLPTHLKMKIEVINGYTPQPVNVVVDDIETMDLKKQLADLQKKNADLQTQNKELQEVVVMKEAETVTSSNGNGVHPDSKDKAKTSSNEAK